MMVLALCHHSLGPKVMLQLLWSKGLTKDPRAGESPQPAQAPEMHVGVCSDPQTGPCTSPWPLQPRFQGRPSPWAERLKPLLAQLNSRRDKSPYAHLKKNGFEAGTCLCPAECFGGCTASPRVRGSPCPAPFCRGRGAVPIPAKPAAPLRRARGGGTSSRVQ